MENSYKIYRVKLTLLNLVKSFTSKGLKKLESKNVTEKALETVFRDTSFKVVKMEIPKMTKIIISNITKVRNLFFATSYMEVEYVN